MSEGASGAWAREQKRTGKGACLLLGGLLPSVLLEMEQERERARVSCRQQYQRQFEVLAVGALPVLPLPLAASGWHTSANWHLPSRPQGPPFYRPRRRRQLAPTRAPAPAPVAWPRQCAAWARGSPCRRGSHCLAMLSHTMLPGTAAAMVFESFTRARALAASLQLWIRSVRRKCRVPF